MHKKGIYEKYIKRPRISMIRLLPEEEKKRKAGMEQGVSLSVNRIPGFIRNLH